nr:TnsD family transposase [Ruminiclostridium cellobioparum]
MSFFPPPYPDELLYSIIARYYVRSGNTSPKMTIEELFNSRTATAVVDMPCNINALYFNLPEVSKIQPEKMIMSNTLFSYYAAFLPQRRVDLVMNSMMSDYGGDIHTRTGIMASNVSAPVFLRYCPECIVNDKVVYGEFYWHRVHQIPGVLVCPIHYVQLQDSSITVHGMNRHEFFAANGYNCRVKPAVISINNVQDMLVTIAKDIAWLMDNYQVVRQTKGIENGFRYKYISILKEKGFATANGRVYQEELIQAFRCFYGDAFLSKVQCDVKEINDNWLSSIVRKHRKAFHPLRHLLIIRFLTGNINDFFEQKHTYAPFGKGPWPCMNAAACHYRRLVVKNLKVEYSSDLKKPVGTFTCSCGFIYSRSGPDEYEQDIYKIGRTKQFGPLWENELRELVETDKLGLRHVARILNVDTNTVKRYVKLLSLKAACKTDTSKAEPNVSHDSSIGNENTTARGCYRAKWLELKYNHPEASKTQLRNMNKATYIWLYRHDRDWLNQNSPVKEKSIHDITRVNWSERDKNILKKVKQLVIETLNNDMKPKRITIGYIGKKLGQLSLLEKHLNKMPKTQKYLTDAVETTEQFKIRRIRWCANELRKKGEEIKEWKLIRMAGIRPGDSDEIKEVLYSEINYDILSNKRLDVLNHS